MKYLNTSDQSNIIC